MKVCTDVNGTQTINLADCGKPSEFCTNVNHTEINDAFVGDYFKLCMDTHLASCMLSLT